MFNIDLHCHSNVSDGLLPPGEVVARAAANGVHVLALTDHDATAGLADAQAAAEAAGIGFVSGVEISVTWDGQTVHVVGLRINP
ncbi:MAG: PHP domain-containing protein, partial [Gammaproteobacteria bacterium]